MLGGVRGRRVGLAAGLLAGVVAGGALLVARGGGEPAAAPTPFPGVDWRQVPHPMDCGQVGYVVTDAVEADLTGDGVPEAAVGVRCAAGAGSPPSGVFVYSDSGPGRDPRRLATLLDPEQGILVESVAVSDGVVVVDGYAYSSARVPRCCPDRRAEGRWRWDGHGFAGGVRTTPADTGATAAVGRAHQDTAGAGA